MYEKYAVHCYKLLIGKFNSTKLLNAFIVRCFGTVLINDLEYD